MKRILVVRNDRLGDLMLILPALRLIKSSIPNITIDCLADDNYKELETLSPYIDNIISKNELNTKISKEKYDLRIFNDVLVNLKWLSDLGIKIAGITNMDIAGNILIKKLGLEDFLQFIVTSLESGSEKPDSKIFLESIKRANIDPSESLYIGDQIESDYLGSQNVGMFPVLIDRYSYYQDFSGVKIKNLDEIKTLI